MTSMWKESRDGKIYRFRTNNIGVAKKLKRRAKFFLTGTGLNCKLWLFIAEIRRLQTAKKILKTITGGDIDFNSEEEIFYSKI